MIALLYTVFLLSGAAGLIYEAIWSRYLGLFVGHSAYAQIIVLVIFLGGMSAGALLAGRASERLKEPLRWYALTELAAGLIGLVFHDVYVAVTAAAYDHVFPTLPTGFLLTAVKWGIAGLLILPQSVLLGATFPLMSAGVLRRARETPGRVLALLYFTNSAGAAVGVLVAGFVLIELAGLPGTLLAAAMLNLLVAAAVFLVARAEPGARAPVALAAGEGRAEGAGVGVALGRLTRLLLVVSFGTAVASFVYEIAWIRMLSLVLGSATHSFELMLSAFILGIAGGAWWVRARADRFADPVRALAVAQWAMGALAVATLPLYVASFGWMAALLGALDRTAGGYRAFTAARYAMCLAVMFPATFCAGMTLPLITKTLVRAGAGERAVGQVYGVNTLGSIAGAALAGLVLLPLLGLKLLLLAGALVDMGLGVLLFAVRAGRSAPARQFAFGSAAATAVLLTGVAATTHFDRAVLTSGVYRYGTVARGAESEVRFYKDGRTATVSVRRSGSLVTLATNGKPDASLDRAWYGRGDGPPATLTKDASTQALLPLFALAHAPRARTAAVIGQGSGMTTHFLLASAALRDVTTIEIEPEMVRGSRLFYPANRRAFDDPRSHYVIDDAKSYFAAANRRFDVIVSEPSNPWVSGVSGLFTDEFYARVTRYLAPDGVFGQWLHLYEIDDALVLGVISALSRHFRSYAIYYCSAADVFIVASTRDSLPAPDWSVAALPGVREDLRRFVPLTAQGLDAMRLIGGAGLAPLLAVRAAPNSDFYPFLDLGAERARFMQSEAEGFRYLSAGRFDVAAALEGRRVNFGTERLAPTPEIARVNALALGARLRAARSAPPGAPAGDSATEGALYRLRALEDAMASGRAPSSWRLWARQAADVEGELHGGTAGVADEAFYAELARYMARAGAPAEAREAIDFLHAAARWDWPAAARLADRLVPRVAAGAEWLPPELVHDAAVVAKIEVGDAPGAERVAAALAPVLHRSRADLRSLLIASYVRKVRPSR